MVAVGNVSKKLGGYHTIDKADEQAMLLQVIEQWCCRMRGRIKWSDIKVAMQSDTCTEETIAFVLGTEGGHILTEFIGNSQARDEDRTTYPGQRSSKWRQRRGNM